jgi:hypothetical protein
MKQAYFQTAADAAPVSRRAATLPAPGAVLTEIAFMLALHLAVVLAIVSVLAALGFG